MYTQKVLINYMCVCNVSVSGSELHKPNENSNWTKHNKSLGVNGKYCSRVQFSTFKVSMIINYKWRQFSLVTISWYVHVMSICIHAFTLIHIFNDDNIDSASLFQLFIKAYVIVLGSCIWGIGRPHRTIRDWLSIICTT